MSKEVGGVEEGEGMVQSRRVKDPYTQAGRTWVGGRTEGARKATGQSTKTLSTPGAAIHADLHAGRGSVKIAPFGLKIWCHAPSSASRHVAAPRAARTSQSRARPDGRGSSIPEARTPRSRLHPPAAARGPYRLPMRAPASGSPTPAWRRRATCRRRTRRTASPCTPRRARA